MRNTTEIDMKNTSQRVNNKKEKSHFKIAQYVNTYLLLYIPHTLAVLLRGNISEVSFLEHTYLQGMYFHVYVGIRWSLGRGYLSQTSTFNLPPGGP